MIGKIELCHTTFIEMIQIFELNSALLQAKDHDYVVAVDVGKIKGAHGFVHKNAHKYACMHTGAHIQMMA